MKMTKEHFQKIKIAMNTAEKLTDAQAGYKAKGLSQERYMWDLFRIAAIDGNSTTFTCTVLYKYLNDSHINTALKAITADY